MSLYYLRPCVMLTQLEFSTWGHWKAMLKSKEVKCANQKLSWGLSSWLFLSSYFLFSVGVCLSLGVCLALYLLIDGYYLMVGRSQNFITCVQIPSECRIFYYSNSETWSLNWFQYFCPYKIAHPLLEVSWL